MSVSVSMPQLGESVTEGTVTRWLKREGEHVNADEPLLEVSTDKVDTEIPSPVSGILRGITVAEDETVAVGAQLAVIDEEGAVAGAGDAQTPAPAEAAAQGQADAAPAAPAYQPQQGYQPQPAYQAPAAQAAQPAQAPAAQAPAAAYQPQQGYQPQAGYQQQGYQQQPAYGQPPGYQPQPAAPTQQPTTNPYQQGSQETASYQPAAPASPGAPAAPPQGGHPYQGEVAPGSSGPGPGPGPAAEAAGPDARATDTGAGAPEADGSGPGAPQAGSTGTAGPKGGAGTTEGGYANGAESPYVTPLVRKLAAEHGIDLAAVAGTGVGGRIRKQDVLDAARVQRSPEAGQPDQQAQAAPPQAASPQAASPQAAPPQPASPQAAQPQPVQPAQAGPAAEAPGPGQAISRIEFPGGDQRPRSAVAESSLRGTTERMSRARQVIAQRMVESLQTSAQLTTVVEADVTAIARLRERAKAAFEAREGVKLSFLPFFALAAVESLKAHPKLNSVIDTANGQVTYHDAEHLGVAVDTERGLMVPVIRNAGDLNIGGLARKIADLAARTRAGHVSPDDLAGGTFTLTNTGSRGALFDTPIINQPQVGILGTGTVVKRAVVVDDPQLGEVITVRSMVYLALTYDHRLVDGADAARFLTTLKARLEEGTFETELGL
jgi:pyruvate dehydrogenase E2 component (dihydrolipoamide acetyltransferase)